MEFEYTKVESLPRLAWLARLSREGSIVSVTHGPWVEAKRGFFVEGAWDGTFSEGRFANSLMLMGSGGISDEQSVLFCGASHPLERLFLLRDGHNLYISPSLVFLLSASGSRLDINHIPYQADLLQFQRGLRNHIGELPLAEGRSVTVIHYRDVRVREDLDVEFIRKPDSPHFRSFEDYKRFLVDGLKRLSDNASDSTRSVQYSPISTISSGYDSAACAALSLEIGCDRALTIRSARPGESGGVGLDDRGTPVAEALGLKCIEFDRDAYRSQDSLPEAEFVACGDLGQDLPLVAMESELSKRFVITGEHGDTMWSRHWDLRNNKKGARDIVRPDCAGCSMIEYRLRVGFIHVPVPCIAATSLPDVKRIGQSDEMAPWTLGTRYDRPIARRFVEERQVDRQLFGQSKKAVTVLFNNAATLAVDMSPASYASFQDYYRVHSKERDRKNQRIYNIMFQLNRIYLALFSKANRVLSRLGIPWSVYCPIPARFRQPPGQPSYLFHWGVAQIKDRYAEQANGSTVLQRER